MLEVDTSSKLHSNSTDFIRTPISIYDARKNTEGVRMKSVEVISGKRSLKIERIFECNLLEVSTSKITKMAACFHLAYFNLIASEITSFLEVGTHFFGI